VTRIDGVPAVQVVPKETRGVALAAMATKETPHGPPNGPRLSCAASCGGRTARLE
jgi:hypothetical protein